jgi:hypothetical protein
MIIRGLDQIGSGGLARYATGREVHPVTMRGQAQGLDPVVLFLGWIPRGQNAHADAAILQTASQMVNPILAASGKFRKKSFVRYQNP